MKGALPHEAGLGEPGMLRRKPREPASEISLVRRWLCSDHKRIATRTLWLALALLALGGLLALSIRHQWAWPWRPIPGLGAWFPATGGAIDPQFAQLLLELLGTWMVFCVVLPLLGGGLGNLLIPLMIGAPELAFPRLTRLAHALWLACLVCAATGLCVVGTGVARTWWLSSLGFAAASTILCALNQITTVAKMRAPGLTMLRLPLTVWGLWIAALLQLFTLPVVVAAGGLQLADELLHTSFFSSANLQPFQAPEPASAGALGGPSLVWRHCFWFGAQPALYAMALPAIGMVSDILAVYARKPIFGYRLLVAAMGAIGGLGCFTWGRHLWNAGLNPALSLAFAVTSALVAVPGAIVVACWLLTLWKSRIYLTTAMLHATASISMFILGGLSGVCMAVAPVGMLLEDTQWASAHFHSGFLGSCLFAVLAALHHWFPKLCGRRMHEGLGKLHFAGTFVLAQGVLLMLFALGLAGMPRELTDPSALASFAHLEPLNQAVFAGAFLLGAWQVFFLINLVHSWAFGRRVGRNPWRATTLEWETSSPPAQGNFDRRLWVERGPFEYADPDAAADFQPQARPGEPVAVSGPLELHSGRD